MTERAAGNLKYTLATHAAEKLTPSSKALRLCEQIADGKISADHAIEQIKRDYGLESGHTGG